MRQQEEAAMVKCLMIQGSAHLVRSKHDQSVYVAKKIQLFSLKPKEQDDSRREVFVPIILGYFASKVEASPHSVVHREF